MNGYTIRSAQTLATGAVAVLVVTDDLHLVNVTMPKSGTVEPAFSETIEWALSTRPRPPL